MQVFESVRHDLGTRRRERCVRLDVGPRGAVLQASLNDLERQLADALRATFEARQAAYDEEVHPFFLQAHTHTLALCCQRKNAEKDQRSEE